MVLSKYTRKTLGVDNQTFFGKPFKDESIKLK